MHLCASKTKNANKKPPRQLAGASLYFPMERAVHISYGTQVQYFLHAHSLSEAYGRSKAGRPISQTVFGEGAGEPLLTQNRFPRLFHFPAVSMLARKTTSRWKGYSVAKFRSMFRAVTRNSFQPRFSDRKWPSQVESGVNTA